MSVVRLISDLHFNHRNMAHTRGFESANSMNNHIINSWNKVVGKKDFTYILGDITMEKKEGYELLNLLNGNKYVILGNHDRRQDIPTLYNYVNGVMGLVDYKKIAILSHAPIHPNELRYRYKYNIHGHVHENSVLKSYWCNLDQVEKEKLDEQYINVCAEMIDYTPKTLEELIPNLNTKIL